MNNSLFDYFIEKTTTDLVFLSQLGYERSIDIKDQNSCWIRFVHRELTINLTIGLLPSNNQLVFDGFIFDKRPGEVHQTIDLPLLIPYYYDYSKIGIKRKTTSETAFIIAKEMLDELLPFFAMTPLIDILSGKKWLNGFFLAAA